MIPTDSMNGTRSANYHDYHDNNNFKENSITSTVSTAKVEKKSIILRSRRLDEFESIPDSYG